MPPTVSVLMSVYNGDRFLREAVDSILAQTHADFEFVVVNDGSTDDCGAILASYTDPRLKVLNIANCGLPAALNYGLEHCTGEVVLRMDADDVAYPHRFATLLADWEEAGRPEVFGSGADYIDEQGTTLWGMDVPTDDATIKAQTRDPMGRMVVMHPTVLLVKEAVLLVGGYDPYFKNGQDFELWLRMTDRFRFGNSPRRLLRYRFRPDSDTARYTFLGKEEANLGSWVQLLALQKKRLIDAGREAWWGAHRDLIIAALRQRVDLVALQREAISLRLMTDAKVYCRSGKPATGLWRLFRLALHDPGAIAKRLLGQGKTDVSRFLLSVAEIGEVAQAACCAGCIEKGRP